MYFHLILFGFQPSLKQPLIANENRCFYPGPLPQQVRILSFIPLSFTSQAPLDASIILREHFLVLFQELFTQ
jgi:hypothetical protein